MSLKRFGVSLEDNLLESLDQYVNENGFANRSQAIRFLIEKNVAERKWQCSPAHSNVHLQHPKGACRFLFQRQPSA